MKRFILTLCVALLATTTLSAQEDSDTLLEIVKNDPILSWGGCDVVAVGDAQYIVAVADVEVGTKKIPQLRTVGNVKAKRELLLVIKGSTVTSTTEMTTSEEVTETNGQRNYTVRDTFFESIREEADGFVQGMTPLGMWFSDDRSLFFDAIYKSINQ